MFKPLLTVTASQDHVQVDDYIKDDYRSNVFFSGTKIACELDLEMMETTTDQSSTSSPLKVLIVGAGIAGLATAIALRREGHNVEVSCLTTYIVLFRFHE